MATKHDKIIRSFKVSIASKTTTLLDSNWKTSSFYYYSSK